MVTLVTVTVAGLTAKLGRNDRQKMTGALAGQCFADVHNRWIRVLLENI